MCVCVCVCVFVNIHQHISKSAHTLIIETRVYPFTHLSIDSTRYMCVYTLFPTLSLTIVHILYKLSPCQRVLKSTFCPVPGLMAQTCTLSYCTNTQRKKQKGCRSTLLSAYQKIRNGNCPRQNLLKLGRGLGVSLGSFSSCRLQKRRIWLIFHPPRSGIFSQTNTGTV